MVPPPLKRFSAPAAATRHNRRAAWTGEAAVRQADGVWVFEHGYLTAGRAALGRGGIAAAAAALALAWALGPLPGDLVAFAIAICAALLVFSGWRTRIVLDPTRGEARRSRGLFGRDLPPEAMPLSRLRHIALEKRADSGSPGQPFLSQDPPLPRYDLSLVRDDGAWRFAWDLDLPAAGMLAAALSRDTGLAIHRAEALVDTALDGLDLLRG
ncbi:hypothetical protein M0638_04565 [Roseomonas sp. NAR14]|uniref:Uncharacterized protein n=1 Tax=Roseomonas acroporae TaxID=2937791 RepID=A0A9X1Y487_9PROT|nr:hypothetical protein [Roseomonas acroporae]MCK8783654.1 hypothetical protein [Roseomonas acroporae]